MDSTDRNGVKRTCFKRKIKRERKAKSILSETTKKGREEIRYYFCRECNAWHLTSKKRILIFDDTTINQTIDY